MARNRSRDLLNTHFSNDAVVYDYDVNVLRWFDRYLKGIENGIDSEPRARYYVVGENKWRTSCDWTPVEAKITPFYLRSSGHANSSNGDGVIVSAPPEPGAIASDDTFSEWAATDSFIYNPADPVADSGERDPENLRKNDLRSDILVYTSAPLHSALIIAGELSAEIYAASTGVDTDWVVTLSDVDGDGNAIKLSNYIVRAKYRNGVHKQQLLTPGQVEKYTIFMPNIAYTFAAGHRIRFTITSSSKFVAFPNTNTGLNPYDDPAPLIVKQTIYHSPSYPSHVKLPVLSGTFV